MKPNDLPLNTPAHTPPAAPPAAKAPLGDFRFWFQWGVALTACILLLALGGYLLHGGFNCQKREGIQYQVGSAGLSNSDILALRDGDLNKVSTEGLLALRELHRRSQMEWLRHIVEAGLGVSLLLGSVGGISGIIALGVRRRRR